ncbi:MAG: transposase [Bacillota bacterium]|nr:transposase [Bacillota bacterium]
MGIKSARYDEEFKEHAVKMVVERNCSITEVASDLGVSQPTIRRWVKERTEPGDSANRRLAELEVENKKLKRKLENAEETIDVLKKSVAIFVNP